MTRDLARRWAVAAAALPLALLPAARPAVAVACDYWNAPVSVATFPDVRGGAPDFAPDGTRIAYTGAGQGGPQIWVADFNSSTGVPSNPRSLTAGQPGPNGQPKWSPDAQKILFISGRDQPVKPGSAGGGAPGEEIYVMDADGTDPVRLTHDLPGSTNFHAFWSPTGSRIAWVRHVTAASQWDLMVADFVEQPVPSLANVLRLSDDSSFHEVQDWTPDGVHIMETVTAEGVMNGESFLTDPQTGTRARRLTHSPYWDEQFHPSPDGQAFAQMSGRAHPGASSEVQRLAAEQGTPPALDFLLTGPGAVAGFLTGPASIRPDLYLIDPVVGDARIRRITFEGDAGGGPIAEFDWSPDGRYLAWGRQVEPGPGGFQVPGAGPKIQVLTFGCSSGP